ncbi:MAG: hypothetical protein JWR38_2877 [Mucilaginibacter sp.]|nr:hypothetical protein [Mucilaginibacter sp.]
MVNSVIVRITSAAATSEKCANNEYAFTSSVVISYLRVRSIFIGFSINKLVLSGLIHWLN